MNDAWGIYVLAILAGVAAGIINTLAGSGSAVTLPMLIFMGLPPDVANATNRVGVAVQNVVGIATFKRSGKMDLSGGLWLTIPAAFGAAVGAFIATDLDQRAMELAIGGMLVIVLFVVLLNPSKWLREQSEVREGAPSPLMLVVFFVIGAYGGFIQVGVGIFLLVAMVMGSGYTLVHANAVKLMIVLAATIVSLAIFIWSPVAIDWGIGALVAVGQSAGAWMGARFATRSPRANVWVRRLLIAVIVGSVAKLFGLFDLVTRNV